MRFAFLFLVTLISSWRLSAQIADEAQVSFSFNCYLVGSQAKGVTVTDDPDFRRDVTYYYYDEGVPRPIDLTPGIRSKQLRYRGPETFTLYEQRPQSKPDEEIQYLPVASIKISPGQKQVMFVLIKSGASSDGLIMLPFDLDLDAIKPGYAYMFNLSHSPLICSVGSDKFKLTPLSGRSVGLSEVGKDFQLNIQCATREADEWELVYSGSQTVKKKKRYLFLLSPIGTYDRFRLIRFKL
ncbi:hypothetical protein [Rubellicoccus peritrichatus]|uniref:Uncharacterized protein n=1 Tax=Rubellicoccus peritrichatus TaxID=3080537 RepID=A0AAQ3L6B7_9BACT|nr:hypothetical protein [Puniceicoccus sp. CR14]WOO39866.1 hypothetical protein RZN69_14670 [Puniceicoccus sp. CR14]